MTTRFVRFAAFGVAAIVLARGHAWAQVAAADHVVLTWDESSLTDAEYVRLVRAIAGDVPPESWPIEKVLPGDGLEKVVDRIYDFYTAASGRFARPMPLTVAALIDLIAKENDVAPDKLVAGESLRVPPIPARAKTIANGTTPVRLFDPRTQAVGVVRGNRLSLPEGQSRDAVSTRVVLSAAAAKEAAVGNIAPPPSGPLTQVRLFQNTRCPSPTTSLDGSPYLGAARLRLKQELARVRRAAEDRHLVIIDFDFPDGHGAKVKSAAEWLLDRLQVAELSKFVDVFDLARGDGPPPEHLRMALKEYQDRGAPFGTAAEADATASWLLFGARPASNNVRSMPAQILQAALSSRLRLGAPVLNLSWGVISAGKVLPFDVTQLLTAGAVVVVAVGNDERPLDADFEPQNAASTRPQFINVTYGSPAGEIYGTWHNPDQGRVEVSALGCGYRFGRLTDDDEGSSFAAPVVAASAWLKHLLDNTSGAAMRPLIARASTLVPPREANVMAGGVFDPARLIANPGPHYVDRATNQAVPLTDVRVASNECGSRATVPTRPGSQQIVVYKEGRQFTLLRRSELRNTGSPDIDDPCSVAHLVVTAQVNGKPWGTATVEEFMNVAKYIVF